MSFQMAEAYVDLLIRDETQKGLTGATTKITDEVEKTSGKTKTSFGGLVKGLAPVATGLTGMFAGAKIADFIHESVDGWRDHQRVLSQTAAVIKSTGGAAGVTVQQMSDLSDKIESNTGVDGDNVLAGQNMLLTFTNIKNGVGQGNDVFNQATQTLTDLSVATGQSMSGAAVQLGKALNDPIAGISALSRVGVTFTEQQKTQIKTMVQHGNVAGAQKIILGELNKEFGGSAKAQETSTQKMQVAMHNLQDTIGQALVPIITKASLFLSGSLVPALTNVAGWAGQHLVPILSQLGSFIQKNTSWLIPLVSGILAAVAAFKIVTIAMGIFNAVMAANPIFLVIAALVALGIGLVMAYNKVGWFRDFVNTSWHVIASVTTWLWANIIKPVFTAISVYISITVTIIRTYINIWMTIFRTLGSVTTAVFSGMRAAIGWISSAFASAYSAVSGYVSRIVGAVTSIPGRIGSAAGSMLSAGRNLISSFWSGIRSGAGNVGGFVSDLGSAIKNGLNNILHLPLHIPRINTHLPGVGTIGGEVLIPALAKGGIIPATPGGRLVRVAEAGQSEAVVPLDRLNAMLSGKTNDNRPAVHIEHLHVTVQADDIEKAADVFDIITEAGQMASTGVHKEML